MTDISTHTKLPWACTKSKPRKITANGVLICTAVLRDMGTTKQNKNGKGVEEAEANARFIVKAVNSHDPYEAVIEKAAEWFDEYARSHAAKADQAVGSYEAQSRRQKAATNAYRRDELRQALATARGTV